MNIFRKLIPNVFVVACEDRHEKGTVIEVETKHGKTVEVVVHNLIGKSRDGLYLYSQTRNDGTNNQTRAAKRAAALAGYAANAKARSGKAYEASKEGRDFLSLGEPIKMDHHSGKRHRALIERNDNRMRKSVEESRKADEYLHRAEYWKSLEGKIDLSMPESLEYFEFKLEEAKAYQEGLKAGTIERLHSFSLPYATKAVKELSGKLAWAKRLWEDQ